MYQRRAFLWVALTLCSGLAVAQQPARGAMRRTVRVDVLVTTQSGQPATDLDERDFSLWDNNILPTRITSFKVIRVDASRLPQMMNVSTAPQSGRHGEVVVYELTFDAAVAKEANEYHSLGVRVDRPKLMVLARQGYYAKP